MTYLLVALAASCATSLGLWDWMFGAAADLMRGPRYRMLRRERERVEVERQWEIKKWAWIRSNKGE